MLDQALFSFRENFKNIHLYIHNKFEKFYNSILEPSRPLATRPLPQIV
jgi:hypothetical protein